MTRYFDIGVNLTSSRFDDKRDAVVASAQEHGVTAMMMTGTDIDDSYAALALARHYGQVSTAGVHPHNAACVAPDWRSQLLELVRDEAVVAVGECGLDFNRNFSSQADQLRVFEQQLEIAAECGLPIFLHERDAFAAQIELLKRYMPSLCGGVAHCFTGNRKQMEAYLELGLSIGVTGWICDPKRGQDLITAVAHLPLERLMLETDAPYLAPKTVRPRIRCNEPQYLPAVADTVAQVMERELSEVGQAAYNNAETLFKRNTA